jgi:hypothetical protein
LLAFSAVSGRIERSMVANFNRATRARDAAVPSSKTSELGIQQRFLGRSQGVTSRGRAKSRTHRAASNQVDATMARAILTHCPKLPVFLITKRFLPRRQRLG